MRIASLVRHIGGGNVGGYWLTVRCEPGPLEFTIHQPDEVLYEEATELLMTNAPIGRDFLERLRDAAKAPAGASESRR